MRGECAPDLPELSQIRPLECLGRVGIYQDQMGPLPCPKAAKISNNSFLRRSPPLARARKPGKQTSLTVACTSILGSAPSSRQNSPRTLLCHLMKNQIQDCVQARFPLNHLSDHLCARVNTQKWRRRRLSRPTLNSLAGRRGKVAQNRTSSTIVNAEENALHPPGYLRMCRLAAV
jgi:hypothetical protein